MEQMEQMVQQAQLVQQVVVFHQILVVVVFIIWYGIVELVMHFGNV
jgi:hypothetical protein